MRQGVIKNLLEGSEGSYHKAGGALGLALSLCRVDGTGDVGPVRGRATGLVDSLAPALGRWAPRLASAD